jgi:hypothetical protein
MATTTAATTAMTAADLLQAVTEITALAGHPIAMGDEIKAWCDQRGIDWGRGRGGDNFYTADHANAPTPLRKFKEEPVTHTGPNGWCLVRRWTDACAWCATQSPQWRAVPWNGVNWIWMSSARVDATTDLETFDQVALSV